MKIRLYSILRNEEKILPYFLRHYQDFVDDFVFYDGRSTDQTRSIIEAHPKAEWKEWPGTDGLVDDEFVDFYAKIYKEARQDYDWVICCDADEFLYHPDISRLLGDYMREGVLLPRVMGYNMVSEEFPTTSGQIYEQVRHGFPEGQWNKQCIFNPKLEMGWKVGRHELSVVVDRKHQSQRMDIKLLHMRFLGLDYVNARHMENWNRVPALQKEWGYGPNTNPECRDMGSVDWYSRMIKENSMVKIL